MVQNHLELKPWTKYLGSTRRTIYLGPIPWTKYHRPKPSFPTCMCLSFHESACVRHTRLLVCEPACTHGLVNGNLRIPLFLHSVSLNCDLSSVRVAIKDNICVIVPNLCHNANSVFPNFYCQCRPHIFIIVPHRSPVLLLLGRYIIIVMPTLIIL